MVPSVVNREPWQGHSQVFSVSLKATSQPRCVHSAETAETFPTLTDLAW
jgi:hypothetical protein